MVRPLLIGLCILFGLISLPIARSYTLTPQARQDLHTCIDHYYATAPLRNTDALIDCIRHARTVYPFSKKPLSIDTIDALTAADMLFLDMLATVAQRHGYAQQGRPFPQLNRHGRALYYEAEQALHTA